MKSKAREIINLLDNEADLKNIEAAITSYMSIIDHLKGEGFAAHPAPDCMNRGLINALESRIKFLLVKRLAIENEHLSNTKTQLASIVQSKFDSALKEVGICDEAPTNSATIRRYIYADASEMYISKKKV